MNADEYLFSEDSLTDAVERADVEELFQIWRRSFVSKEGEKTRKIISKHLPEIAEKNKFQRVRTFKGLVQLHDVEKLVHLAREEDGVASLLKLLQTTKGDYYTKLLANNIWIIPFEQHRKLNEEIGTLLYELHKRDENFLYALFDFPPHDEFYLHGRSAGKDYRSYLDPFHLGRVLGEIIHKEWDFDEFARILDIVVLREYQANARFKMFINGLTRGALGQRSENVDPERLTEFVFRTIVYFRDDKNVIEILKSLILERIEYKEEYEALYRDVERWSIASYEDYY